MSDLYTRELDIHTMSVIEAKRYSGDDDTDVEEVKLEKKVTFGGQDE